MRLVEVETSARNTQKVSLGAFYVFCIFFTFFLSNEIGTNYLIAPIVLVSMVVTYRYADVDVQVSLKTLCLAIALVAVFALLNFENLTNSLSGDHWYHAFWAYVIPIHILMKIGGNLPDLQMSTYLQAFALFIASALVVSFWLHRISKTLFIIFFIVASIGLLIGYALLNISSGDQFPALRLLPLSVLGVFGFESWIFRLQGAIAILMVVYYLLISRLDIIQKTYCLMFLFSLPMIYFNSLMVEFSIWAFAALTLLYLQLLEKRPLDERTILILGYVLVLAGLVRGTAVFGLVPLCVCALMNGQTRVVIKVIVLSIPTGLYILKSALLGTPASYLPEEIFLSVPVDLSALERLVYSLSFDSLSQLWATSGPLALGLVLLALGGCIYKQRWLLLIIFVLALAMFWSLFHLVRPVLWGNPRYQLEYVAPLAVVGFFTLAQLLRGNWRHTLIVLIACNVFGVLSTYRIMPTIKIEWSHYFRGETPLLSEKVFDTQQAVSQSMERCNGHIVQSKELPYSIHHSMPLIFSGAKISEFAASIYTASEQKSGFPNQVVDGIVCEVEYLYGRHQNGFYNSLRNTTVIINLYEN
jgi:hypothetical protein